MQRDALPLPHTCTITATTPISFLSRIPSAPNTPRFFYVGHARISLLTLPDLPVSISLAVGGRKSSELLL